MFGGGVKYFPSSHLFIDLAYFSVTNNTHVGQHLRGSASYADWGSQTPVQNADLRTSYSLRGLMGWSDSIFRHIFWNASMGVSYYRLHSEASGVLLDNQNGSLLPVIQCGIQYRPQERIGLGINLNYELQQLKRNLNTNLGGATYMKVNQISFEPTLSIYF